MEPCPRCGRAEMANMTHPCVAQVMILGPAFGIPLSVMPERETEIRRLSAGWFGDFALRDTLVALDETRADVGRLRDALRRYGEHDGDCAASVCGAPGDARCTCGYDDAVANGLPPLRPRAGEKREP